MHLVYDINAVFRPRGDVIHVLAQLPDIFNTVIRRRINLRHVHYRAVRNPPANLTFITGRAVFRVKAVYRAGKNLRRRGFARTARPAKKVCVRYMSAHNLISEGLRYMILTDNVLKNSRTPFSVNCLIRHFCKSSQIRQASVLYSRLRPRKSAHIASSAYCCSVPRLTRFTVCNRTALGHHRHNYTTILNNYTSK